MKLNDDSKSVNKKISNEDSLVLADLVIEDESSAYITIKTNQKPLNISSFDYKYLDKAINPLLHINEIDLNVPFQELIKLMI